MARIRSIKPDYASDGKVLRLSDTTALFFVLLWNHCDDSGYFTTDTLELSTRLSRWRSQDIKRLLSALHRAGMVRLSEGHGVGMVVSWHHQKIDKPRPSKWQGVEIKWDDATEIDDRSTTVRRKDRIGEDRKGEDGISSTGVQAPAAAGAESSLKKSRPKPESITRGAWDSYSDAYLVRYKTSPVRNATVNSQLAGFVKRIGEEEAPAVAGFYLTHNDQFYVRNMHPVGLLLKDAEKLRTEWVTGQQMLGAKAREVERVQASSNSWDDAARILNDRRAKP